MKESNRKKVLIIAYFLSKYDRKALESLNYKTFTGAFKDIGERLGIKPNTIKNRRDDFDSVNDNSRSGWYQKEISKSSLEVVNKFEHISEDAFSEIVKEILFFQKEENDLLDILENDNEAKGSRIYNNRGVTGKQAERLFINYFNEGNFEEYKGELIDTREQGCGYDFKLQGEKDIVFEVKGLSSVNGGISFTDKEWAVAKQLRGSYILILINNVFSTPNCKIIPNPYEKLNPTKRITKVISINWTVQCKELI